MDNAKIGIISYVIVYVVGCSLFYFIEGERAFFRGFFWAFVPTTAGVFVAYYVDRIRRRQEVGWKQILLQGALGGFFAAVSAFLTTPEEPYFHLAEAPTLLWIYVGHAALTVFLVGVAVALIFPWLYRKRVSKDEDGWDTPHRPELGPVDN